jgi:hypothetical protein
MSDEIAVPYQLPLDADGFLRRECPTCEREFKWHHASSELDAATPPWAGGYFCPYCAVQAQPTAWFTQAQLEYVNGVVEADVVGPEIDKLGEAIRDIARRSGGLIQAKGSTYKAPARPDPLTEDNDMRQVDFPCHPTEPVKVSEDYDGAVHCLVCGAPTDD